MATISDDIKRQIQFADMAHDNRIDETKKFVEKIIKKQSGYKPDDEDTIIKKLCNFSSPPNYLPFDNSKGIIHYNNKIVINKLAK